MSSPIESLYLHFPFCESKCHYCDFYSLGRERTRPEDPARFEAALKSEVERSAGLLAPRLKTIFMGGGTPSLTAAQAMEEALESLWRHTQVDAETEWTMEANPSSIDRPAMEAYRKLGVNRISMGVQAVKDELLVRLGRVHSSAEIFKSLENIFSADIRNVSVDLLCGVPGQTMADLEEALLRLTDYPISHLSCYLLTLPKHHRMYPDLPDEETQLQHLLFVDEWMTQRGFQHYEISNYAKPGKQSKHNLRYWTGESYLGLGPSAHSFDRNQSKRWKNVSSLHKYAQLLAKNESPIEWTETLTPEQHQLEKWMLALRLDEGFPESWLEFHHQKARVTLFKEKGLIEIHPHKSSFLRLTPKGFALSDQVISALA